MYPATAENRTDPDQCQIATDVQLTSAGRPEADGPDGGKRDGADRTAENIQVVDGRGRQRRWHEKIVRRHRQVAMVSQVPREGQDGSAAVDHDGGAILD